MCKDEKNMSYAPWSGGNSKSSSECSMCLGTMYHPFATLRTVGHQAALSMGFSRQESWSGLPCPPPGDLPDPGMELVSPLSLALQEDSFPLSHQISPYIMIRILNRSFSKKKKKDVKSLSHVRLCAAPWTIAYQAPPSMEFSRQEYWSGLPFPWSFSKWPINSVKQL